MKPAAFLKIDLQKNPENMKKIAVWLHDQADYLVAHQNELSNKFMARFFVEDVINIQHSVKAPYRKCWTEGLTVHSVAELAKEIGVSKGIIYYRCARSGDLPFQLSEKFYGQGRHTHAGGRYIFDANAVSCWRTAYAKKMINQTGAGCVEGKSS